MSERLSALEALRRRHSLSYLALCRLTGDRVTQFQLQWYEHPDLPGDNARILGAIFESIEPSFFNGYELTAEDLLGPWEALRAKLRGRLS